MKLSATSWSFPLLTLAEAGRVVEALGIDGLDLGLFYKSSLDKKRILADPEAYGEEIRATLPVRVANYYHLFGSDLHERNLALPPDPENLRDLKAALEIRQGRRRADRFHPAGNGEPRSEPERGP